MHSVSDFDEDRTSIERLLVVGVTVLLLGIGLFAGSGIGGNDDDNGDTLASIPNTESITTETERGPDATTADPDEEAGRPTSTIQAPLDATTESTTGEPDDEAGRPTSTNLAPLDATGDESGNSASDQDKPAPATCDPSDIPNDLDLSQPLGLTVMGQGSPDAMLVYVGDRIDDQTVLCGFGITVVAPEVSPGWPTEGDHFARIDNAIDAAWSCSVDECVVFVVADGATAASIAQSWACEHNDRWEVNSILFVEEEGEEEELVAEDCASIPRWWPPDSSAPKRWRVSLQSFVTDQVEQLYP